MYEIELLIDGEKKKFIRNEAPMLGDLTRALKIQQHQVAWYTSETGPTDEQIDTNTKELAEFAVNFWNKQFKYQQVINGLPADKVDEINEIVLETLGQNEDSDDEDSAEDTDEEKN